MKKFKVKIVTLFLAALAAFLPFCLVVGAKTARVEFVRAENAAEIEETPDVKEDTEEDKTIDIDAFLEALKPYAEQAGIGNDYKKAVEAIKTAASKKQVTISTFASCANVIVFVVFIIWKNTKDGQMKRQLVQIAHRLDEQVKGTNALIDDANAQNKTNTKAEAEIRQLKKGVAHLAKMFSLFTERVNLGASTKEEIRQESLTAQKVVNAEVDGEKAE